MDVKAILATGVLTASFVSLWVATYYISVEQPNTQKRHLTSAAVAAVGLALQLWLLMPADGKTEIGWGWLLLSMLCAVFFLAMACAAPGSSRDVLRSHAASRSNRASENHTRDSRSSGRSEKPTRAISTGWSIGMVAFSYKDSAGDVSFRTVTVHSASSQYLKGECHDRQAERTFRLDRIVGDLTDCETGEILSARAWVSQHS